jgi:hypothetical protein
VRNVLGVRNVPTATTDDLSHTAESARPIGRARSHVPHVGTSARSTSHVARTHLSDKPDRCTFSLSFDTLPRQTDPYRYASVCLLRAFPHERAYSPSDRSDENRMARQRKSMAVESTEGLTRTSRSSAVGRRPGRPPIHEEAWTKVTVVLFNRQIVFLDRLAANIRAQSGAAISRAQLIRALVDAAADADIDLASATSETDLKSRLLDRLGRYRFGS